MLTNTAHGIRICTLVEQETQYLNAKVGVRIRLGIRGPPGKVRLAHLAFSRDKVSGKQH